MAKGDKVDIDSYQLYEVITPSGGSLRLQTQEEAEFYNDHKKKYLSEYKITNGSDLLEVERVLMMEVMVHRWSTWLAQGFDYEEGMISNEECRKNIKEYCVSEDTELLTPHGWKTFDQLVPGDMALSIDRETGMSIWRDLQKVNVFKPSGPVYHMKTRDHDSITTGNHRWYVQRITRTEENAEWVWQDTEGLDKYSYVPTSAIYGIEHENGKFSDAYVELVAWWYTEGSCTRPNLHNGEIGQSHTVNPREVALIRRALWSCFGEPGDLRGVGRRDWNETRKGSMTMFNLSKRAVEVLEDAAPGKVPSQEFLLSLTASQTELFIETSVLADGSHRDKYRVFSQRDKERIDAFQFACILGGYQANITHGADNMYHVNVSRRTRSRAALHKTEIQYDGLVWCPDLGGETWLARRNGTVYFTGNSAEIRASKQALGIDRLTRTKDKGEDVANYVDKLLTRARQFGYMRNEQSAKAIQLFKEAETLIGTFMRCDEQEREHLRLDKDSIFKWFTEVAIPEFNEIDRKFRQEGPEAQKMWIKEM